MTYVELHTHSAYSFLDGASHPEELVLRAAELGYEALALEGAQLFDPSGQGKPFKQWVVVPAAHADRWESFAERALEPA